MQHENLEVAFSKACDYGLIDHYVEHRSYDYSRYYPELKKDDDVEKPSVLLGKKSPKLIIDIILRKFFKLIFSKESFSELNVKT